MNKKLVLEAFNAYRLTCGARAIHARKLGDEEWKVWAQKGMELEQMMEQVKRRELVMVEQQVMEL